MIGTLILHHYSMGEGCSFFCLEELDQTSHVTMQSKHSIFLKHKTETIFIVKSS